MTPRRLVLPLALLLLSACSVLPQAESPVVYLLPAAAAVPRAAGATPLTWSLQIDTPQAVRALDGNRIAVVPEANVISTYKGARWNDRPAILLRNRLLDAFQANGRIQALVSDDSDVHTDYVLDADLRAFQTEYENGRPIVVIRYDARLLDNRSQHIVAARRFEERQPVAGKDVPQVVAAFGQAGDALAAQLIPWTIGQARTTSMPQSR